MAGLAKTDMDSVWKRSAWVPVAMALSPDGQLLALPLGFGGLGLYRAADGESSSTLAGHIVACVAISPDGRWVASGGIDHTLMVWSLSDGTEQWNIAAHDKGVSSVAFSRDSTLLATGSADSTVKVWDLAERRLLRTLVGHQGPVNGVAFSPDGEWLASAGYDDSVRVWSVESGEEERTLPNPGSPMNAVAFSPDGSLLAAAEWAGSVEVWSTGDWSKRAWELLHEESAQAVAFSPDGQILASAGADGIINLWRTSNGKRLRSLKGHDGMMVSSISFSADGRSLASLAMDETVKLWRIPEGMVIATIAAERESEEETGEPDSSKHFESAAVSVRAMCFSPAGDLLATANRNATIALWRVDDGRRARTIKHDKDTLQYSLSFSPDGRLIAGLDWNLNRTGIKLWTVADGKESLTLPLEPFERVDGISFSPNGDYLAAGSSEKSVKLWRVSDGALVRRFDGHEGMVYCVVFSPDGKSVISAGSDKTIRIWSLTKDRPFEFLRRKGLPRIIVGHRDQVRALAISPDGSLLASGSDDKTIRIWSMTDGRVIRVIETSVKSLDSPPTAHCLPLELTRMWCEYGA